MKSAFSSGSNSFGSTDPDICSPAYAPTGSVLAKAASTTLFSSFAQKKIVLDATSAESTGTGDIQGSKVIIAIRLTCSPATGSLSERVLMSGVKIKSRIKRQAFSFIIPDDLNLEKLEAQVDADPCVIGVTSPGVIKNASLALPTTNDPYLARQFHLASTNYLHAYENFVLKQDADEKVKLGFLDSGVDCSHEDLKDLLASGCGFNAITDGLPSDADGHGSHTMGLAGAVSNNERGVMGIAGGSLELHAIKVIGVGSGTTADAYDGIQYAIEQKLDVINLSLVTDTAQTLIEQGVREAVEEGIVVVMAAGNKGEILGSASAQQSPARIGSTIQGAITVGSLDVKTSLLSRFSNYGSKVEIAAPGAYDSSLSGVTGGLYSLSKSGKYQRLSGTSQAAPLIAGAASLIIQFLKQHGKSYTPADIERLIMQGTDMRAGINVSGGRILNYSKLVRATYAFAGVSLCD